MNRNRPADIRRLLIVRNDRVGDLVLTLPALDYARQAFPQAEISLLVASHIAVLLQDNPHVDRILSDDKQSTSRELAARLKQFQFDAAIVIHTTTRNCSAVWRAGIPIRVTWASKLAGLLLGNRRVWLHRSHPPIHEVDFARAFVERLHTDPAIEVSTPSIQVDDEVSRRIESRIQAALGCDRPWFGVHPGSYGSTYNWPIGRYCELVERLTEHGGVLVTGGPGEEELLANIKASLPPAKRQRVATFHDFDLAELAAAIDLVDVLTVSNTGPMHLAGVLGKPMVALFSAHPLHGTAKWGPFGDRNTILKPPLAQGEDAEIPADKADEHMARISIDEVVKANLQHLRSPAIRRSA